MSTNKSVSPAEFRLHSKIFAVNYSPSNYFEHVRLEIIFQQLVMWFWRQYGVYFYVHKLKVVGDKVLLQVYFYKTYIYQQNVKKVLKYQSTKSTGGRAENAAEKRQTKAFDWFYMYSPELFSLFLRLKTLKHVKLINKGLVNKVKLKQGTHKTNVVKRAKWSRAGSANQSTARPQHSVVMYNHFFTYFFLHFFKMPIVILSKSLYKAVITNGLFKYEHRTLLHRTRFLKWHQWSFDFLFLTNFALTFSNMNFILPFYLMHVVKKYRQFKYAELFFNILRKMYFYKRNIRAIKVLINGPYNRHGRTHFRIFKIGDLALSQTQSCVMYDAIQWLTPYGAISLKLWVYYADYLITS